ncbi:MAG: MBL fold metallo-hydrolase [Oscillospiraceae bacterium]|nr:MBL fold metallo-hydrolase [Oscillospiraceae bacterium]
MLKRIQVMEQSGIRIVGEKVIYIDPLRIVGAPHDADLILFTHPHPDHFSPKDVKKLMKDSTVVAAPKSMAAMCRLRLGRKPVPLLPGKTQLLCGITVETVAAYNRFKLFHLKARKWLGYILTIGQTRVYISGDTDITEESKAVSCDIALLPVGGAGYTMNPEQAAELAAAIAPHTVIPIHYGKLLGGANAAERFRAALDSRIEADIRPTAFSTVMVSMYLRAAVLISACGVLGYFIGKML